MKRFFDLLIEIGEQVPFKIGDDAIISIEGTYNPNPSLWPLLFILGALLFPYIIAAFFIFSTFADGCFGLYYSILVGDFWI